MWMITAAWSAAWAWTPAGGTWSTEAPIPYWIGAGELGPLPDDDEIAAIHAAFATWSSVECSAARFVYVGRSTAPLMEVDQQNVVTIVGENWPAATPVFAQRIVDGEALIEADVALDADGTDWVIAGADGVATLDLQAGLTTAVGALLGLGESEDPDATMSPGRLGAPAARTLSDDDIAGVCALYPAVLPGAGGLGDPCVNSDGCNGLECVIDATASYCAPTCPDGACPDGYVCLGFEGRRTCAKGGCSCGGGAPTGAAGAGGVLVLLAVRRRKPKLRGPGAP